MNATQNASVQQAIHGKRGPNPQKKNLGREKPCSVKRACEGARKRPPPHTERPWTPCVRGSLAPQATKDADKIPKKGGGQYAPAQKWAVPWESLLRGVGKTTLRVSETTPGLSRKSVAAKRKRGKRKTKQEKHTKTLAASRPKKRPQKVQGESQKRPGPRMAPRKNAKKRDARPKRAEQTKAAGHKKEKEPERQVRVKGCPVTTWSISLKKKTQNQKRRRRRQKT